MRALRVQPLIFTQRETNAALRLTLASPAACMLTTTFLTARTTIPIILIVDLAQEILQQPPSVRFLFREVFAVRSGVHDQIRFCRKHLHLSTSPLSIEHITKVDMRQHHLL